MNELRERRPNKAGECQRIVKGATRGLFLIVDNHNIIFIGPD